MIRDRVDQNGRSAYTGNLTFNASGNSNTTGNALADALLGNFRTYSEASADPMGFFRFWQPGAFIQDSWKVNQHLSIELGVRWEWLQPWYTEANNMANFVPALYDPSKAVTINAAGRVVPGSGNLYNGLIRAGNGVPADQQGRVPGSTTPFFTQIPAGAPRGFFQPQNTWSPALRLRIFPHGKDGAPRRLRHLLHAPARQHDLLAAQRSPDSPAYPGGKRQSVESRRRRGGACSQRQPDRDRSQRREQLCAAV